MKRVLVIAIAALLLVLALPAAAQSSDWSLYLYNSTAQEVLRVYAGGNTVAWPLHVDAGTSLQNDAIDFRADGNQMAYCTVSQNVNQPQATLVIQEMAGGTVVLSQNLGQAQGCWVKYSSDGQQIAVSLVHYYIGDTSADTSVPPWELLVIDAATGQKVKSMSMTTPPFDKQTVMPEVRSFVNEMVVFVGIPWGTEGSPISQAYAWSLLDGGAVQPINDWAHSGLDSLVGTGELVWTELDSSKPAAKPNGPIPQANVVKLLDASGQERVIYSTPDSVLVGAQFIDNGQQLAIEQVQGGATNPGDATTRWVRLDRDGSTYDLAMPPAFAQIAPAPDGYVILWASDNTANADLTLEYHTATTVHKLWEQSSNGGSWSLLWTAPTATAASLPPFMTAS